MMTTKLTKTEIKRLENLGISKVKTVEEAIAKAIKKLDEIGCNGFDDEELDTMLSILESYANDSRAVEEVEDEHAENDLAVEAKTKEAEPVENDEKDRESRKISDDDIHDAIHLELAANEKGGDEPKNEPEPKVTKSAKKAVRKTQKTAKVEKTVSKKETAKPTQPINEQTAVAKTDIKTRLEKWNPLENEADRKLFDVFEDFFPQGSNEFEWKWAKDGLTVKYKGANNKKVICYLTSSGSQKIKIWLPCLIGKSEILDELNIEYNDQNWNKTPIVNRLTVNEAVEVMKAIKDVVMKVVKELDKKQGA
jgi:hypothetical protein